MIDNCLDCDYARQVGKSFFCWRFPPVVVPHVGRNPFNGKMEQGAMTAFPMVTKDICCGEYSKNKKSKNVF